MKTKITYKNLSELSPYPNNPRVITEQSLNDLCLSIQEDPLYFETRPIICSDRTGNPVIIAGEKRYLACLRLGIDKAPVAIIPNLTEEDERRILIKDNGSFGDWDNDMLKELEAQGWDLQNVKRWGADIDISLFDKEDNGIASDDFEQTKHLTYLHFNNYKIPVSEVEELKLNQAIDRYLEDNGTLVGFVNSLFEEDEPDN